MDQAKGFDNFELHAMLGSPSENSVAMSTSSLSLNESIRNDSLEANDSPVGIGIETPCYPDNRNMTSSNIPPSCNDVEKRSFEMAMVINNPDAVLWSTPTKTVVVKKGKRGTVGFQFKGVKASSSYYLLVHSVATGSPAYDKLKQGDLILSVDGHPMDCAKNIQGFASIVKNSNAVLKFVVQSPRKILVSKLKPDQLKAWLTKLKHQGNEQFVNITKSVEQLHVNFRSEVKARDHVLDLKMHSLPFLKLFILGKESLSLALSLIGASSESELKSTNDVTAYGYVDVKECNNRYDWVNVEHNVNYFSDVIKLRRKLYTSNELLGSFQGDSQFQQNIRLKVVSVKEGRISDSCYQLLLCKHAIYAIQFSVEQLIADPTPVLQTIQKHLCKIRCYASTCVRVYLIGTQDHDLSSNVCEIGKVLEDRFSATYGKMLQYDAKTNVPCFVVTVAPDNQQKLIPRNLELARDTCLGDEFELKPQNNDQLRLSKHVRLYNVQAVMNDISKVAIGQKFMKTSYPYRYLQRHKQVHDMRDQGSKCVLRGEFGFNCNDSESLLTYLHDSGDIINAENLLFPFSTSATPDYLIMIDPQHLITAACAISNALPEAQCHPQDYNSWRTLKTTARAEKTFLAGLMGENYEVDFLEIMNVIHCLPRCDFFGVDSMNNDSEEMYLVPVYLHESSPNQDPYVKRKLHQQLCVDFKGFIPDGLFLRSAMLIVQKLRESRVRWSISYRNSISVQMPGKFDFVMECDALKGIININAMWDELYGPLNLLSFLTDIFDTFKSAMHSQQLKFLIGPPCPLSCDECHQRHGVDWKTHVVDLSLYSHHKCLLCGRERIDEDEQITPWIRKKASVLISQVPDDMVKCLSLKTPVLELPSKVIQIICDNMNGDDSLHRNWEGLAGVLKYTFREVNTLRSKLDPTWALLEDYGKQKDATLSGILQLFKHQELRRFDIIRIIEETFEIVE